ncbi:hypothetical protein KEM56_002180 [Ascosphaera pollenicola]|nr:hypothetical protein KEM56_002180 [Ascosphaera pollenicola]
MAERSLGALIHSLQTASSLDGINSLLPRATGLLTILSNPLNLSLLSSHLLSTPAIWASPFLDLQACRRIVGVYNSAAMHVVQREEQADEKADDQLAQPQSKPLKRDEWVQALISNASSSSNGRGAAPWRHLLLLGGLLIGLEGQYRQSLSLGMRRKLIISLIETVQAALRELPVSPPVAGHCVVMVLTYTWDLLSVHEQRQFDSNVLLTLLMSSAFMSEEGLEGGLFFDTVDKDMKVDAQDHLHWSAQSPSFERIRSVAARPLVASFGPTSKLIAHCLELCHPELASQSVDTLLEFSRTLLSQWRRVKLCGVDPSVEVVMVGENTLKTTLPVLRQLFKMSFFSTVISLRAVMGRVINDNVLATDAYAPYLAMKALHILRNFCFVSALMGSSSQYTFVSLTSIDILAQFPHLSQQFLEEIRPTEAGRIPAHPLDRCLDLYFLNTAEHFSLVLTPEVNEHLLISAALPYLSSGADSRFIEIFEAAHSVTLSVLAAPKSAEMASRYLELYVNNLFSVFPANLSARQLRLAYKTILQITAPPSPLANSQPLLSPVLLDMLYQRALNGPTIPLPPTVIAPDPSGGAITETPAQPLSEQAVLTLALIDCLCFLNVEHLEEWLPLTAELINRIPDMGMRKVCQERFWEAMSDGEMDVQRAHFCVIWWSTRGGREAVLFGEASAAREMDADGGVQEVNDTQMQPKL